MILAFTQLFTAWTGRQGIASSPPLPSHILPGDALTASGDGFTGPNGSVYNVPVRIGDVEGVYRITTIMEDGNASPTSVTTIIAENGDDDEDENEDDDDDKDKDDD